MRLTDLVLLYGVIGVACAIAVLRREQANGLRAAVWSAVATVPLWPLWAPFVLATPRPRERPSPPDDARPPSTHRSAARESASGPLGRIQHALDEAVRAVAGTPMADVFSKAVATRIAAEVAHVADRMEELRALQTTRGLDRDASAARLRELEARGASERTLEAARLQHESLTRLEELRAKDAQALEELADLLEALRAQLLLARYAGSSAEGTGAIVSEVWARLEGLGAAFETPRYDS
jgi:hypothetical protein